MTISRNTLARRGAVRLLALAGLLAAAGCGILDADQDGAEEVRVTLDGETGTPIRFLVSTVFNVGTLEDGTVGVELVASDTTDTTLPVDVTVDIRQDRRVFFHVVEHPEAPVVTSIWLDGERRFARESQATDEDPVQFIYVFGTGIPPGRIHVL